MGQVVDKPATYADIEALPPNVVGQILFGRLITHPRPAKPHIHASSMLGYELIGPFVKGLNGPGGWQIYDEPEIHLQDHIVVPDIAGWRKERLLAAPETTWFEVAPDWVCEFLSPSTRRHDKGDKRTIYAELGVQHLWYVDPVSRMLEVYRLSDAEWVVSQTYFDDDPVSAPPFEVITFSLSELWDDPNTPDATPSATN